VPTIRFQVLYVFLVLAHDRRRILHFAVTAHPTAEWTAQQLREAFPWATAPRHLLRDRDRIFGNDVVDQIKAMGIKQVLLAPRSPWQRAYAERVIGTIRRECLDHVIVLGERSLYRHLQRFVDYSHRSRTHLGLEKDSPVPRPVQSADMGRVIAMPEVGGLHHCYERRVTSAALRAPRREKASSAQCHPHGSVLLRGPMDGHRVRAREALGGALSAGDAGRVKSEIALSKHANDPRPRLITPQDWVSENDNSCVR
jgi:hypothetical protein